MFKKILIANRGEIACRVAATARRLGIQTVAVYSRADERAQHVAVCDQAVYIGTGEGHAPKDSYLRWHAIIAAAQATGAQAIHPGYGFLSENEEFAQACQDAGLVFIGPSPAAIRAMGLKAQSKRLMDTAGVPLVPGYHGADQDGALLKRAAHDVGYPVLIKASAGGGGKGMRVVTHSEDFDAMLASCKREAMNSFGDDAVLIEKYVQRPRHIEIQVFGDAHGNYVYLFERDCSVQRRHQKVLEEAPAPGMTPSLRQAMGQAAVNAARAVKYEGAGTVEFIVEQPGGFGLEGARFYFMEMNTRLQVEHPVTEAITGLDLVEWQLRVAAGQRLPCQQEDLRINGHAIEARICAENPDNNFLPATGTLQVYRQPPHSAFVQAAAQEGVRVDAAVRAGDTISPHYDSMIAKLIVHGATRDEALTRLDAALAQTHIAGLGTNVQFLRHVVSSASFAQAKLDTALIQRESDQLFHQQKLPLARVVAAYCAHLLIADQATLRCDPFQRRDGWQPFGVSSRRLRLVVGEQVVYAHLTYLHDGSVQLDMQHDGPCLQAPLRYEALPDGSVLVDYADECLTAWVDLIAHEKGQLAHVFTAQGASQLIAIDPFWQAPSSGTGGGRLSAPMPGKVMSFAVKAGDSVCAGQQLAVMEAMKMEHTITAPYDGVVQELLYAPGDQVHEGAALLSLTA